MALVGLAGADYYWKEQYRPTDPALELAEQNVPVPSNQMGSGYSIHTTKSGTQTVIEITRSSSSAEGSTGQEIASSNPGAKTFVKKGTSTKKRQSVNVDDVFQRLQLIKKDTTELSLIHLMNDSPAVKTVVLLRNNDRALLFSWIESDEVKDLFSNLKRALQEQFSGQLKDLIDETRTSASGSPIDTLSFIDPAISKEKIVFLRIRNRLYEIHIAKNGEDVLDMLTEELAK